MEVMGFKSRSFTTAVIFAFAGHSFAQTIHPVGVRPTSTTVNDSGQGISLISSSSGSLGGPWNGLNIADVIRADRFYNNGFNGSRSIVSNVEGGLIWNGHETLGHVSTFLYSNHPSVAGTAIGQFDRHATWVGQNLGGRGANVYQQGIAPGSELWSGGIATSYGSPPWSNSWGWSTGFAFTAPYEQSMLTGVGGRTADVVNSSWGFADPNNFNVFAVSLDGMVKQSGKTLVFAAGNSGPTTNSVNNPGNGFNAIVVGALGPDTGGYQTISNFSSRGPSDYYGPDGQFNATRARVDITAPGESMTLAFYGGVTGGNQGGTDPSGGANNFYSFNAAGTSFASPTVAGGAALIVDAGKAMLGADEAIDGRVVKSVLQTSADKTVGWNNGQTLVSGAWLTTQALDYTYGAGRMNLDKAFDVYTAGTKNVVGNGGGSIQALGWDSAVVSENSQNDYLFASNLEGGTTLTATLNWFVNSTYNGNFAGGAINTTADSFTNLGLELWSTTGGTATTLIAGSNAMFINTQQIYVSIPQTGSYMLRVKWLGERYDFVGNSNERYALSWLGTAAAVPEPASMAALGLGALALLRRRKKSA